MSEHSERADRLLSEMSMDEKSAQLYSAWLEIQENGAFSFWNLKDGFVRDSYADPSEILRNGIGQLTRPFGTRPVDPRSGVRGLNAVQKILIERTRLGIPALVHEECLPGVMAAGSTLFPAAINLGALFDEELVGRVARAIGSELASLGAHQGLAPVLDVSRDVRWGRTEETFGEDPYLTGSLATAYVRGLQGDGRRILATLKHYVGHSFSEGGRNHAPVQVGERTLNDVFLLPFEMAVKLADAGSVMPAYHDIDGEPTSSSYHLLTEVLRKQWGFDGLIVSDYEAINLLRDHHHVAADEAEAAALSIAAGMDMELPGFSMFRSGIRAAVDRGLLSVNEVDAAVRRVLVEKSRLRLFDHPFVDEGAVQLNTPDHRRIAREAAERSIVLLSNDGTLPLQRHGKTALIGPLADDQLALFSGYSFPVHLVKATRTVNAETRYAKTLREVLEERGEEVLFDKGCDVLCGRPEEAPVFPGDAEADVKQTDVVSYDRSGIARAVETAERADRIVIAVGDLAGLFLTGTVGEGSDTASLSLPGVQQELVDALLDLGKPTVIVVLSGRPYNIGTAFDRANATVQAWFPGQEGAEAIADILFGTVNPAGRLPVSIPRSAGAMPYFYNHKLKSAGTPIQRDFGAIFPFGHGLSYTTFTYGALRVEQEHVPVDGEIVLSFSVENSGRCDGEEVAQLYVRANRSRLVRPVKELKGFLRFALGVGKRAEVRFVLPTDMLSYTTAGTHRVVEPGTFEVMIGPSSGDIRLKTTVELTGTERELPRQWRMRSQSTVVLPDGQGPHTADSHGSARP